MMWSSLRFSSIQHSLAKAKISTNIRGNWSEIQTFSETVEWTICLPQRLMTCMVDIMEHMWTLKASTTSQKVGFDPAIFGAWPLLLRNCST
mmetsp:Transcript_75417/g.113648  ORF Transcript_75417/g.113648 Transcript_75417/m.113648 type:complete len:91 (+) Transcript_75417:315-587(+)